MKMKFGWTENLNKGKKVTFQIEKVSWNQT